LSHSFSCLSHSPWPFSSPQDKYHLYFLFDLMSGGDLMDVLVAEAKVINRRVPESSWQIACLAPNVKMLQV
jgi:cGMP-dependent protein kinase 2